jgi:hypothetical protein
LQEKREYCFLVVSRAVQTEGAEKANDASGAMIEKKGCG